MSARWARSLLLALVSSSTGQVLTGMNTIAPEEVAFLSNNITALEQENPPFQIYHSDFLSILGSSPSLSLVYTASFPAFHEAGVVTSVDPLTLYSSSNQFNTTLPSPTTNNKTIVISRTTQNSTTGIWTSEVVQNDTAPMYLANGGFQYQDGILFVVQGTITEPAGLVYLPTTPSPTNSTVASTILDNYLGTPLNSPNDIYVTLNGVIYFTDPEIGYRQFIRPPPKLPNQVYGYSPNTTDIRVVANEFQAPNGIQFSPDEKTVYVTDTGAAISPPGSISTKIIYKYDVVYSGSEPQPGEIASFQNKRVFAMPAVGIPDGIKCDSGGNVWVGNGDGLSVYNPSGRLLGKVIVENGVANFGFANDGRLFAMSEKKLWFLNVNESVQPGVPVGQRRG